MTTHKRTHAHPPSLPCLFLQWTGRWAPSCSARVLVQARPKVTALTRRAGRGQTNTACVEQTSNVLHMPCQSGCHISQILPSHSHPTPPTHIHPPHSHPTPSTHSSGQFPEDFPSIVKHPHGARGPLVGDPHHRRYGTNPIKPLKVMYALKVQFKLSVKCCSQFSPNVTWFLLHRLLPERAEECHRVAMTQRVKHESEILWTVSACVDYNHFPSCIKIYACTVQCTT